MRSSKAEPERRRRSAARRAADTVAESAAALLQRPGRSLLTAVGTLLGVGAFVATLGLATTAATQVSGRFDALKATEVTVQGSQQGPAAPWPLPHDAEARLRRLRGVERAGVLWQVENHDAPVQGGPAGESTHEPFDIVAASPGTFAALHAHIGRGRPFDAVHDDRRERVAVIGAGAARALNLPVLRGQPAIRIAGISFTVIGVMDDLARRPELLRAIVIPERTATGIWGESPRGPVVAVIETSLGAAQLIARQAPLALRPDKPSTLSVTVPPDPQELRRGVESDVGSLIVGLAAVSLLIGAVGIANTTLVSVLERTGEIGLRRAVGASRGDIAAQVLFESAILGLLGGLLGAACGVMVVSLVSAFRDWTAVLDPVYVFPAPALGALTGLISGLYPAIKAARVEPVVALRR